jgi:serine/threonine protein kinase
MVEIGQLINGKYRVVRLIGDGGMGSVYEANHELLGSAVALKFLHSELAEEFSLKERFLQEAHVSATIQSPHIVRVLDVDVTNGVPFLVMDLLKGQPLQRKLSEQGRFGVEQALGYTQQILTGLQAAHERNIVHRDLKPDNVFITYGHHGEELLKLLDFGIAKVKQAAGEKGNLTQPGAVMGTPEYMAPEQAYSADQVDARSDVYSVGVMLFEMLSGRRPAEGETPQDIAQQILFGTALRLDQLAPELPSGLVRVVHTAIEPRPEDRWADARALREALLPFVGTRHPASTHGSTTPEGHVSAYIPVAKTPRIDGTRPAPVKVRRPTTKRERAASLEIPVEIDRGSQVPATIPPTEGPPRASALPPSSDPAVAPTIRQTASMPAVPPSAHATATVNSELVPHLHIDSNARGLPQLPKVTRHTVVARRKSNSWIWITLLLVAGLAGGGVAAYAYYEQTYNSPVPPPRPVLRYPNAVAAAPSASDVQALDQTTGPTIIKPLDPAALEHTPIQPRPPSGGVAPRPNPTPSLPGTPSVSAGEPATPNVSSGGPLPPFTLPTSLPFPVAWPSIALPTAFPPVVLPSGFSIPGLTPPAANSQ